MIDIRMVRGFLLYAFEYLLNGLRGSTKFFFGQILSVCVKTFDGNSDFLTSEASLDGSSEWVWLQSCPS